ncbi:hypothetical protein HYS47_01970 [Candidatus Woesearchaeota archaeon]|nr:hypothetical protein [Candidatus Woesearchaeota archaeon]
MVSVEKEKESAITGIAEKDLLWLERVVGITDQVLGDIDLLESDGVKVFLDLLQKNTLFGKSLNKEISTLYNLLIRYREAGSETGQEEFRKKIISHTTDLQQLLLEGIAVLKKIRDIAAHFLKEEELLQTAAEAFCQVQLKTADNKKTVGVQSQITRVLRETKGLLDNITNEFQSIYQNIEKTLWPAIQYAMSSKQKISLEEPISQLGRLHMRILSLASSVKKERQLLKEEIQYNRQLRRITVELMSLTKEQATKQHVRQQVGNIA